MTLKVSTDSIAIGELSWQYRSGPIGRSHLFEQIKPTGLNLCYSYCPLRRDQCE